MSGRNFLNPCIGLIIWMGILIIYLAYLPGVGGATYYDDAHSLSGLASIQDTESALYYIFSGETGPLGRPISLTSFLLHLTDWPSNPENIFRVNILIHLINGLLLVWLILKILELAEIGAPNQRPWVAIGAMMLWMALPILVSTSLIAVQRMTSLSATFTLLGLLIYVKGIECEIRHRIYGWILQGFGICGGTVLAVLSKENGALLPVYALVLEFSLFQGRRRLPSDRSIRFTLLSIPLLLIVTYMVLNAIAVAQSPQFRPFSIYERAITQPLILWDYLRLAFFPRIFSFSPFHEHYPHSTSLFSPFSTLIALLVWIGLIITAIRIRTKWPMLTFAVFWFLAGHLLESILASGLELYYEHRNYLPLVGPCLALSWLVSRLHGRGYRIAWVIFTLYISLTVVLLHQTTLLWGNKRLAAEIWHQNNLESPRAAINLAAIYANDLGDGHAAIKVFDQTANACVKCIGPALEALMLSCTQETREVFMDRIDRIRERVALASAGPEPVVVLMKIYDLHKSGRCEFITNETLTAMNRALLENPAFAAFKGPAFGLHYNLYNLYWDQGDVKAAFDELQKAWQIDAQIGIAQVIIDRLIEWGLFEGANQFMNSVRNATPNHPFLKRNWLQQCDRLDEKIISAQRERKSNTDQS